MVVALNLRSFLGGFGSDPGSNGLRGFAQAEGTKSGGLAAV